MFENLAPTLQQEAALKVVSASFSEFINQNPFTEPLDATKLAAAGDALGDLLPVSLQAFVVKYFFADGTEPDYQELEDVVEGYAYVICNLLISIMELNHAKSLNSLSSLMLGLDEEICKAKIYMDELNNFF